MSFIGSVLKSFISPVAKAVAEGKADKTRTPEGKPDWAHMGGVIARYVFILAIVIVLAGKAPDLLIKVLNKVNIVDILN